MAFVHRRESSGKCPLLVLRVARVVLADKREDVSTVAEEIRAAGGDAVVVVSDASKEVDCKRMVDTAMESFGALHVAFDNHGVSWFGHYATALEKDITRTLDTNLKSLVFCFKYQIPAIAKSGGKGSIIVNSSIGGTRVSALGAEIGHSGVYAASKAGAEMLMKYAAIEGAASGVRVNAVAPGLTDTSMLGSLTVESKESLIKNSHIIQRIIQPEEIAKLVIFLASDDAAMITGTVYPMDGGIGVKA